MVYAPNGDLIASFEAPKQADNPLRFIRPEQEDRANARLGAAAPSLLDALKMHVGSNGHTANCTQITMPAYPCSRRCQMTRAALAAAEPQEATDGR